MTAEPGQAVNHLAQTLLAEIWRLKTHISGVLVNHRNMAYTFVDLCEWSQDSNLTINVLLATLADLKESVRS